jgi:hypothetical protein
MASPSPSTSSFVRGSFPCAAAFISSRLCMVTIFGERFAPECGMSQDYPSHRRRKSYGRRRSLMAFRPALGLFAGCSALRDGRLAAAYLRRFGYVLNLTRNIHLKGNYSSPTKCLRPLPFASVLPPTVVGLGRVTRQCRLVISRFLFSVFRQKRGCYPQRLNFSLQPRHIKLLLLQNCVNIPHVYAPCSRSKT